MHFRYDKLLDSTVGHLNELEHACYSNEMLIVYDIFNL